MTESLANSTVGGNSNSSDLKFMDYLTDPLVKSIIKVGYTYKLLQNSHFKIAPSVGWKKIYSGLFRD